MQLVTALRTVCWAQYKEVVPSASAPAGLKAATGLMSHHVSEDKGFISGLLNENKNKNHVQAKPLKC